MTVRKIFIAALLSAAVPFSAMSQNYSSLWKQFDKACEKDHPQDELAVLAKIRDKARGDKAYGQLLKSELQTMAVQSMVSPDSLLPQLKRYEAIAVKEGDTVLGAVYCSTLGHIYRDYWGALGMPQDSAKAVARQYYGRSLRSPKLLAATKAGGYEPLVVDGDASATFGDDLFHVLAMEAEEYGLMHDYYQKAGNRPAACISAYYQTQKDRMDDVRLTKKSRYLATIDSLINVYRDLPEAGELAIEHFNYLDGATDASAREKVEYIDYALVNWPSWQRMAVLKNARNRLTLPSFNVSVAKRLAIPGEEIPVYVTSLTHLDRLSMNVYKVNIAGGDEFNPNDAGDYNVLRSKLSQKPVWSDIRVYYGLPEYLEVRDTMKIAPLPAGVYMVEFTTDNDGVAVERAMLHVSNLRLVCMQLPGKKMRMAVMDATSGKPVAGAKIELLFRGWKNRKWNEDKRTLTTEEDGEVVFTSTLMPYRYMVTTDTDKAFPWQAISGGNWSGGVSGTTQGTFLQTRTYTDRAVYRPGQTVKLSVLAYEIYSREDWKVAENRSIHLALRDPKGGNVEEKDVVTDEWGVASAEFTLPADGLTGYYSVAAKTKNGYTKGGTFRVEEYKRPTFSVTFDEYKGAYKEGDTIRVKGWAKTYSGVAVQNAAVKYDVRNIFRRWCMVENPSSGKFFSGETVSGSDGSFTVDVPIKMPDGAKKGNRFASVIVTATVTDRAGESHSAQEDYPVSDKPTFFALQDFGGNQCRERQTPFSFACLNNSGQKIDTTMTYRVDTNAPVQISTNTETTLDMAALASGRHVLTARCGSDTLRQEFIVFSLKDTGVPVDTVAWYYSTTGNNTASALKSGEPEYIQLGTKERDQTVLYAVVADTTVIEAGQMVLNDEVRTRTIEYKEEWGDGIAVRYAWVRNGELYTYEQRYAKPTQENRLTVEWKTFRDKLTPGQKEEWVMTVKNADGTPAKAQTMAVMYDKSLDTFRQHNWSLDHRVTYFPPYIRQLAGYNCSSNGLYGEQKIKYLTEPQLEFSRLDIPAFGFAAGGLMLASSRSGLHNMKIRGGKVMFAAKEMVVDNNSAALAETADAVSTEAKMADSGSATDANGTAGTDTDGGEMQVRENLNETAFFMPQLVTDKSGNVSLKFTLPESLTTWQFMSLSHDKQMNTGLLSGTVTAQKKLMMQPNMPRFIRVGDKAQMSAVITNNHDNELSGKASMLLVRPADGKTVAKSETHFTVKPGEQTPVTFSIPDNLAADIYVCRVTAQSSGCSDGEQQYLPILSDKVEVTTTRAFTQVQPGEKTIDIKALYGKNASKESLKVEYTDNPAWLMLEALPTVGNPDSEDAISLAVALYANSITEKIKAQMPSDTLVGKTVAVSAERLTGRLANLQNADGSFSWFDGMMPSYHVTQSVAKILARMKHLGLAGASVRPMLKKAMEWLDGEMSKYVTSLKKQEKDSKTKPVPSESALDYLYIQSISGDNVEGTAASNSSYLLSLTDGLTSRLSIYGKANMAIVSALHPVKKNTAQAKPLLESVRQYTVKTEEMGRYFDTPKAQYSWCDYRIPTQTAAIEALQTITPDDRQTIADMQQWLLQEKHTQQWNTPLNTASAIYAFFNGWNFSDDTNAVAEATESVESTRLYVDNRLLTGGGKVKGKGYVSRTLEGRHSSFKAVKTSGNISWGALYAVCTQPLGDVEADGESLSVKREVLDADGNRLTSAPQVGQTVKVRLTVVAKRDLDFVEITDNRAACLEPVVQTSGYRNGCHESPRDNRTVYCFDKFAKGKHVLETSYYVDRAGAYKSGTVTAKCLYAPEFQARDKGLDIETK